MSEPYDILIVGAGPAGLSTALHLAKIAPHLVPRTLILEKARHPRPKLCAGGLLPDGEVLLRRLGLDVNTLDGVDVRRAHLDYKGRGLSAGAWGNARLFRVIRREEFDSWLADAAHRVGFSFAEETTARRARAEGGLIRVETESRVFHARAVVGADGSNSVIRRAIPENRQTVARALELILPNDAARGTESFFDFAPLPRGISGYVWDFPARREESARRCWGIYDSNLRARTRAPMREILSEEMAVRSWTLDEGTLQGHPIRLYAPHNPIAAQGILLAGDAAGVDTLLGEGISFALGYGLLAAIALREAFERNDFSFSGYSEFVRRSPLGRALRRRRFLAKILYRLDTPEWQRFVWQGLGVPIRILAFLMVTGWGRRMKRLAS